MHILLAAAVAAATPQLDVKQWELQNGLSVLFVAKHTAPVASVYVFYHVGSKDEPAGKHGMAHMFEHMMFKGSKHVKPEMHARMLDAIGGVSNAFTTEDITGYFADVPKGQLGFALKLEAERMRNLLLTPQTVASEREVVKNERRQRIDDNPGARAFLMMRTSAFHVHPYSWSAIGENADLDTVTPKDCQAFYDLYYQPNNATLVIVGDLEEADVRREVEAAFAKVPRGAATPREYRAEPPQKEYAEKTLHAKVQVPIVVGGFHIPAAADDAMPALEVLARVLGAGESSRLHQALVKTKTAVASGAVIFPFEHPGLFIVYAAHLPKLPGQRVKQAMLDELARYRENVLFEPAEVEKARNQILAEHVRALETANGVAGQLGRAQYIKGGWQKFLGELGMLAALSPKDLHEAVVKYLSSENLTMVVLEPEAR
jgi:zinc protease